MGNWFVLARYMSATVLRTCHSSKSTLLVLSLFSLSVFLTTGSSTFSLYCHFIFKGEAGSDEALFITIVDREGWECTRVETFVGVKIKERKKSQ